MSKIMKQQIKNEHGYVREYVTLYFDKMIVEDIRILKNKNLPFTLPYILLISAGIDFLGGIQESFYKINKQGNIQGNSNERSCNFIREWMGRVDELYKFENMAEFIYSSVRNGVLHEAIFKENVESYVGDDLREKHLHVRVNPQGQEKIFIHALRYADDFLEAQKIFREEFLVEENIHKVYERLQGLHKEGVAGYPDLITDLKNKKFIFQEEVIPSPSPAPPEE